MHSMGGNQEDRMHDTPCRMLLIAEREIGRMILDIHDGPVQNIFAALSQLNVVERQLVQKSEGIFADEIARIRKGAKLLEHALDEIRTYMGLFRPPEFERRTLIAILDGLVIQHEELTGHAVTVQVDGTLPEVSLPVKICLYRVLQQALSNAARHAGVEHYTVTLRGDTQQVIMEVRDQGKGFDLEARQADCHEIHFGLVGMRERVEILGGTFSIESAPGRGTCVRVVVPNVPTSPNHLPFPAGQVV